MYNQEAEIDLIGGILLDPKKFDDAQGLAADDFADHKRWEIYRACQAASIEGVCDTPQVTQKLKEFGSSAGWEDVDWHIDNGPLYCKADYLCQQIKTATAKRKTMGLFELAQQNMNADYKTFFDTFESGLAEIKGRLNFGKELKTLRESMLEFVATIGGINDGSIVPHVIHTGYDNVDEIIGGVRGGNLCIIAGRTSMGKTTFMLNVAENISQKGRVAIFSMEMDDQELCEKFLSMKGKIPTNHLRDEYHIKQMSNATMSRMTTAANSLKSDNIIIDPAGKNSIIDIRSKSRRLHAQEPLQAIFIDHAGIAEGGGKHESKRLEISFISRMAKQLAKELNVPVFLLAQLNRGVDTGRPRMSYLKESGSLEEDANQVILIHRPEYYCELCREGKECGENHKGEAEIIIDKNRGGRTGLAKLLFIGEHSSFHALSGREDY